MYLVCMKRGFITPLDVVRESQSGDTVETASGKRYRTDTKQHKIFYDYDFARIASKQALGQLDDEYDRLLAQKGLRRIQEAASCSN